MCIQACSLWGIELKNSLVCSIFPCLPVLKFHGWSSWSNRGNLTGLSETKKQSKQELWVVRRVPSTPLCLPVDDPAANKR